MPDRRTHLVPALASLLLVALLAAPAAAKVTVVRKPVEVRYRVFDPANPPKDMPALKADEAALCVSEFGAGAGLSFFPPRARKLPEAGYRTSVVVDSVRMELTLTITIYLPQGASEKLKVHEEGHRQIAERIYNEVSERAAKAAGDKMDGRRFEGDGGTVAAADDAAKSVLATAQTAMIRAYLDETSIAGQKVQVEYDRLTDHSRLPIDEAEAIKQAWAKFPPPMWVAPKGPLTRPATGPATAPAMGRQK